MTTNLNAIAGPSRLPPSPLVEVESPTQSLHSPGREGQAHAHSQEPTVSRPGLSVDENGETIRVPAFLNKLFSMVSDTTTDALIYWSDSGDSFFVPNHEQFGKELLPRFFKHSNFSSFVRQLNMYGFHKVPHLQSGVLKNEAPSELWEFVNPYFKRNQPDLLSRVTRKNNRGPNPIPQSATSATGTRQSARQAATGSNVLTSPGGRPIHLITDGTTEGEAGQLVGPTGQNLDLSAIASNIAAIRQAQTTLTADLQALKASNDHLWREALETREKHRTHEETMGLIISFLERLFGTEGEGLKGLKEALRRAGISGPSKREDGGMEEPGSQKKRKRLGPERMISHGPGDENANGHLEEIENPFDFSFPKMNRGKSRKDVGTTPEGETWSSSSQRFQSLPTDEDARSNPTPNPDQGQGHSPMSDTDTLRATDMNALAPYNYPTQYHQINNLNNTTANNANLGQQPNTTAGAGPMSPRTTAAAASAFNLDPSILQTTIGSLLQSPAAAQLFLNSLNNSVQGQTLNTPNPIPTTQPSYPFPPQPNAQTNTQPYQPTQNIADSIDPTLALFSPLPNQDGLMGHSDNLLKSYQGAAGMNQDVDKLQESIDSLVRSMGLEPNPPGQQPVQPHQQQGMGDGSGFDMGNDAFDSNFDVDQFLTELAKSGTQGQDEKK